MDIAGQKKKGWGKERLKFGAGVADAVSEMLMPFLFLTSSQS